MSSRPYAPTVDLMAASQSASLATSSFTNCARPPAPVMFAATFCRRRRRRRRRRSRLAGEDHRFALTHSMRGAVTMATLP
jgi:hypothetical protein